MLGEKNDKFSPILQKLYSMMFLKKSFVFFALPLLIALPVDLFANQVINGPLAITSPEFGYGMRMSTESAQHNKNRLPTLILTNVPPETRSLAIQMVDPDNPSGVWIHWLAANIPPSIHRLAADALPEEIVIGTNDFGNCQYDGPSPPSGTHHYLFHIYALNTILTLKPGFNYRKLENAMWGHILQKATLMGTFSTNL